MFYLLLGYFFIKWRIIATSEQKTEIEKHVVWWTNECINHLVYQWWGLWPSCGLCTRGKIVCVVSFLRKRDTLTWQRPQMNPVKIKNKYLFFGCLNSGLDRDYTRNMSVKFSYVFYFHRWMDGEELASKDIETVVTPPVAFQCGSMEPGKCCPQQWQCPWQTLCYAINNIAGELKQRLDLGGIKVGHLRHPDSNVSISVA